jgi:hypothetical protein
LPTYHWKAIDEGYNFVLDLISIKGLHKKLWASKVVGVCISRISGLPIRESWDKMTFDARPMAKHKKYYKREGDDFFQVRVVMNLVNMHLLVVHPFTEVLHYALTNLLFGLCKFMCISDMLVICLSPISELQHTLLPPKCYK